MKIYLVQFCSPMYPEDNEIFDPVYLTEEAAQARITEEVSYYKKTKPAFYQAKEWHYYILEREVRGAGNE